MMKIPNSWLDVLREEIELPYFKSLIAFLEEERRLGEVYPPQSQVFAALEACPFEKVKVVILGQDPYHGPGQAEGLAFSVAAGSKLPPSLKNIFKELEGDLGEQGEKSGEKTGSLLGWARQGVLLLNTTLTVRRGAPLSHANRGWEQFTGKILDRLAHEKRPIAFVLWGKHAQLMYQRAVGARAHPDHLVLTSAHPSPFSASKFWGTKPFSKVNNFLIAHNETPIDFIIS